MRFGGRISAAISILEDFDRRRVPLKVAIADWARGARYAGARDRAWISGLCLDVLRRRSSLGFLAGDGAPRSLALLALRWLWRLDPGELAAAAEDAHGPGGLPPQEIERLQTEDFDVRLAAAPAHIRGDYPDWVHPLMARVFGEAAAEEGAALAARADIDLRLNTLRATPQKALAALSAIGAAPAPVLATAARIAAPDSRERAPGVTIIPAFNKGWVEVQDLGSQIAAAAAGAVKGAQVLDYCAGGGGKTLALAALMENTGQLYAYDADAHRLKPLYERAQRAGLRNLQIVNPVTDAKALDGLAGKMEVVFIDAPCTGSGTWRRHPDTKWRLTREQFERRLEEQDRVLAEGARFVKPGGQLVYATCSVFMEENEDRLAAFLGEHRDFARADALGAVAASGLLAETGRAALSRCVTAEGALRLTPARLGADGFFIAVLERLPG